VTTRPVVTGRTTIQVGKTARARLAELQTRMETDKGRPVSVSEAIERLLDFWEARR
jgi:hypothetical protein